MVINIRKVGTLIFFSSFICLASSGKSLDGNQINNGSTVKSSVSFLTAPTIVIAHVGLNTIDTLPEYIPPYSEVLVDVIVNGGVDEDDVETIVAIHNNMNERTWKQVMKWEKTLKDLGL